MAHLVGIVGLSLNMAGTVLLLWFPPTVQGYTADGSQNLGWWSNLPKDDEQRRQWQRKYLVRKWAFRGTMGLLLIGFASQLVDLLIA